MTEGQIVKTLALYAQDNKSIGDTYTQRVEQWKQVYLNLHRDDSHIMRWHNDMHSRCIVFLRPLLHFQLVLVAVVYKVHVSKKRSYVVLK
jgi:hypothetical protein